MHMRLCYLGSALLMTASFAACNRQASQTAEAPASTTTTGALEPSGLADGTLPRRRRLAEAAARYAALT